MSRIGASLLGPVLAAALAAGCTSGGSAPAEDAGPEEGGVSFVDCEASDQAFVRNAHLAVLGRRPRSQAEVNVYVDLMRAVRALAPEEDESPTLGKSRSGADAGPEGPAAPPPDPREAVVLALSQDPAYIDRWADHVMDALKVTRIEIQSQRTCYGTPRRDRDDGSLAAFVRDSAAGGAGDGLGPFTMLDLLRSALVLDDLSPVYRGHLYALVSRPIPAANVPRIETELARREDFGLTFDATYLNRDLVCLGCHHSEGSITEHPDPELSRHFALPGNFERALYGSPIGIDPPRAHAPFRVDGFVANLRAGDQGEHRPWDWSPSCGGFYPSELEPDPAEVDGLFGSLAGDQLTVYELEAALASGFSRLAMGGLPREPDGTIPDPDAAFAYLVSAKIAEGVWEEVIGSPLTISNYFPRNEASRDILFELTESFVASRFSLRALLTEIAKSPYFNRLEPAAGCGESPYNMPPVYDPWTISDEDPARRANGPGDAVMALSARTLLRAAYEALEWERPYFMAFPERPSSISACGDDHESCAALELACAEGSCCLAYDFYCDSPPGPGQPSASGSRSFQRGVGVFLKNGEQGFRGLDFQARLVFEDRFGGCQNPGSEPDFVEKLAGAAAAQGAPLGEVVAALKDRLVGQTRVRHERGAGGVSEREAIEALFGAGLDAPAADVPDLEEGMRRLCGVLLSSPQFLLGGLAAPDGAYVSPLTPPEAAYDAVCEELAARTLPGELAVTCGPGGLTVR